MTSSAAPGQGPYVGTPLYAVPPRRAHRDAEDGILGGVAAGLSRHLGLPVLWIRVAFLVLIVAGGSGALLYAGLWLVLPSAPHSPDQAPGLDAATRLGKRRPLRERRLTDYGPLVAVGAIAVGLLLLTSLITGRALAVGPLLLAVCGIALLWWQADEAQRERWIDSRSRVNPVAAVVGNGGAAAYLRIAAGLLLLVGAIMLFSLGSGGFDVALNVGLAAALGIVGLGFIVGPWLFRLSADLSEEREARVRSEERADVAAHLHDSVLQTLALIQRSANDPAAVSRLARAQERDLRAWLFESDHGEPSTVAASLRAAAAEVEDTHGVHVEVVCVGDSSLADTDRAIVLAAREAMVNAARHAGVGVIDVYAEVTATAVEIYVRDRGQGFDPDAVASDRQGVRNSIVDRMRRHGGTARIRSNPGEGTEVRLTLPFHRDQSAHQSSEESS